MAFVSSFTPLTHSLALTITSPVNNCATRDVMRMSAGKKGGSPFGGWGSHRNRGFSQGNTGGGGGSSSGGNMGGSGKGPRRSSGGGGAADSGGNPFSMLWGAYNARLAESPVATKAFTSLIGFFLGDLIAQSFIEKNADLDKGRLARMASFGFLIHGPTGHYFYGALDRLIVGASPLKVASKVAIDQIMWAPIFTALFFGYLAVAERQTMEDVIQRVRNNTWAGVQASWKFWPAAHAINFAFIPTSQRLLYINCLQVGYNVILSILGSRAKDAQTSE